MFALDAWLRFGVYDAGGAQIPGEPEWPPSPARVFCALVAGDPSEQEWAALRWLEQQGTPEVHCPDIRSITTTEMFVITNETKAKSPLRPGRTAAKRIKPSVYPACDRFAIVWPDATADQPTLAGLRSLARRVPYIGRSSAQAAVEAVDTLPTNDQWNVYQPVDIGHGQWDLGVPYPGYCAELIDAHQTGRRAWEARRTVEYSERAATPPPGDDAAPFGPLARLLVLEGDFSGWSVSQTAQMTQALRAAVMSRVADPLPPALAGHDAGIGHVGFLTLPNVGVPACLPDMRPEVSIKMRNQYADGRVMGMALTLPVDMEADAIFKIVDAITDDWSLDLPAAGGRRRAVTVRRQRNEARHWATQPARWTKPSRVWATATPVVFDQFPAGRSEELMIGRALVAAGYPPPRRVVAQRAPILPGAASHTASSVLRRAGERTKPFCHAWVEFDSDVTGPVMAGSMRFRGLGLFAPVEAVLPDEPAQEADNAAVV